MNAEQRCIRALARIAEDTALNAWSYIDHEGALSAARASDQRRAQGRLLSALDGQLVALKANIAVAGWPWDAGVQHLRGRIATLDAALVRSLRDAGAVLLGLTRMDEAALGARGLSIDGPIGLPRDPRYSPGGSSGGAAVAVAASHCDLAIGTDTLGSVRIPAALCGITALKPHHNSLSLDGIEPLHTGLDQPGPMTQSLTTLIATWRILAADCGGGIAHQELAVSPNSSAPQWIALPEAALGSLPDIARTAYQQQLAQLRETSVPVTQLDEPSDLALLLEAIAALSPTRRAAFTLCERELAKHWRIPEDHPTEATLALSKLQLSSTLKEMLHYGASMTPAKVAVLEDALHRFRQQWSALNAQISARLARPVIWLLPTTPVMSLRHDQAPPPELADWTVLASVTGWAALTLPRIHPNRSGTEPVLAWQCVTADLDNESLCRAAQEMTGNLLARSDPHSLGTTDVQ